MNVVLPSVVVTGDAYAQGSAHGSRFRREVAANIQRNILDRNKVASGLTDAQAAVKAAHACLRRAEQRRPELRAELQGIADGAGVSFDDIVELNFPAVRLFGLVPDECTQFFVSRRWSGSESFIGKTRDIKHSRFENVMIERIEDDGVLSKMITHAGALMVPGSGSSSCGLQFGTSGVWPIGFDWNAAGGRLINPDLDGMLRFCRSIDDVREWLRSETYLAQLNVIVSLDGDVGHCFEMSRDGMREFVSSDWLVRTNHFLSDDLQELSVSREGYPSSFLRYDYVAESLQAAKGNIALDDVWDILCAHAGPSDAWICRHGSECGSHTTYASVSGMPRSELAGIMGPPCGREI